MVKEKLEVYKCSICGNIVETLFVGGGTLVCCNKDMIKMEIKTDDQGKEKHLPVIEKLDNSVKIKVGDVPHPMTDEHYIQWVEVVNGSWVNRKELTSNDNPEAEFYVSKQSDLVIRSYCNVHGLWEIKV